MSQPDSLTQGSEAGRDAAATGGEAASHAAAQPSVTVAHVVERIKKYRLVPVGIVEAMQSRDAAEGDPRPLLLNLVEAGHLTRWQAERLLDGRSGFSLGRYTLIDKIGSGGMGVVVKARDPDRQSLVAIKVLSRTHLKNPKSVQRFTREVEATFKLDDVHIVTPLDSDCIHGVPFLVMEYVEGKDLHHFVERRGPLPVEWAAEFCRQTALGLQHAHTRGLVHRDVKPENLLITRSTADGPLTVKILDFGLARFTSEAPDGGLTQAGQVFGTPDYIAPEQARSARSADIRSDVYSLGCTLYFLLTGRAPFGGETLMEKLSARFVERVPEVRRLRPDVPPTLQDVLQKMLERDPAARYQTPEEVAQALDPFTGGMSEEVHRAPPPPVLTQLPDDSSSGDGTSKSEMALETFLNRLDEAAPPEEATPEAATVRPTSPLKRWGPVAAICVAVLALVAIASAFLTRGDGDPKPTDPDERVERPVWPLNDPSLVFAWSSGSSGTYRPPKGDAVVWRLEGLGNYTIGKGIDLLGNGGVLVHGSVTERLLKTCQASGELTIEMIVKPSQAPQSVATMLAFTSGVSDHNFALLHIRDQLLLILKTSASGGAASRPLALSQLKPGRWSHVLVSYRARELVCYIDGDRKFKTEVTGDLSKWATKELELVIGNAPRGGSAWTGGVEAFALLNRFVDDEDAMKRYKARFD